jgi:hypothetical protein
MTWEKSEGAYCGDLVSSTAFSAPPPDLPSLALMDMGFAAHRQLARECRPFIRFLSIGTRFCSTLPSDPPRDDALALR